MNNEDFFILLFSMFFTQVSCCDLPELERIPCGNNIKTKEECLSWNCCFDESADYTGSTTQCYFRRTDAAGGPIRYSNGLCIYPKDGSTADDTPLVWSSTKCSSKNALFLVSHDYSTYHIASGKCILPRNGKGPDPGIDSTLVLGSRDCDSNSVRFEALSNGNLAYYYTSFPLRICIGKDKPSIQPSENSLVRVSTQACGSDARGHHLTYVYQKTSMQRTVERIACPGSSTIQVTWAYYGEIGESEVVPVKLPERRKAKCRANATRKLQEKCNEKSYCYFEVLDHVFGIKCPGSSKHSVIRYTCDWNSRQIAQPRYLPGKSISFNSFDIRLKKLRGNEKYVDIIVMKLPGRKRPESVPGDYKPYHLKPYWESQGDGEPYITAQLSKYYIATHPWFTVGDGQRYGALPGGDRQGTEFINVRLEPGTNYSVFTRTFIQKNLYHDSEWSDVVQTNMGLIQSTRSPDQKVKGPDERKTIGCTGESFFDSLANVLFITVIAIQFVINIILGFVVTFKARKRLPKNDGAKDHVENKKRDTIIYKRERNGEHRASHQYEYPINVISNYEELQVQTEAGYEHAYHSLRTL